MMELRSLRCFLALAEYLNYSRAAESLYISQPTITLRIQELEKELDTALFDRSHHHVLLTSVGAALVPLAREILESVDSIPNTVRSSHLDNISVEPTRFRMGYDITEDRKNVQPLNQVFQSFCTARPGVKLEITALPGADLQSMLLRNELDMSILVLTEGDSLPDDLLSVPVLRDPIVLVSYNAEGKTVDELLTERGITFFSDGADDEWKEYYSNYLRSSTNFEYRVNTETNLSALCLNLQYGNIVSFLPLSYVDDLSKQGLCCYETDLPDVILSLVWNKHILNPLVQTMVNIATRAYGKRRTHKA